MRKGKKVECYFNLPYKLTKITEFWVFFSKVTWKTLKMYSIEPYEIAILRVKEGHILAIL